MNGLDENLLGKGKKQSKEYKRRIEEIQNKVKTLRNKNNQLQKQCDNELDRDVRQAIKTQGQYLEKEIGEIKKLINNLSNQFKDPATKVRVKELWNIAGKQIERNKRIMEQFLNRASASPSFLRATSGGNQNYVRITRTQLDKNQVQPNKAVRDSQHQGVSLMENEEFQGQIFIQERINAEKAALLREIEQKNNKINQLYNDMGEMLGGQQHDMINQMDANMAAAKQNLEGANQNLDQARKQQKKARKKYTCLIITIILGLLIGAGVLIIILNQ